MGSDSGQRDTLPLHPSSAMTMSCTQFRTPLTLYCVCSDFLFPKIEIVSIGLFSRAYELNYSQLVNCA